MKTGFYILLISMLSIYNVLANETYHFDRGNFELAKNKAKEEGKLIFLDFYANWCTPCKWMDETTFKDPVVKNLLESKYIAVKINIDDYEGFELKSKFDVRFLPTMLIFNTDGIMIERFEETLGTTKMRNILQMHSEHVTPIKTHKVNTSPRELKRSPEENAAITGVTSEKHYPEKSIYSVQVGVFSKLESASSKAEKIKQTFIEKVTIIQEEKDKKIFYKVLIGEFSSIGEAKSFKEILQNDFGIEGVIF